MKILLTLVMLLTTGAAMAQTGSVAGFIRDEAGVPLPGVQLLLTVTGDTPNSRSAISDARGAYYFSSLPPGQYLLSATLSGFATSHSDEITVSSPSLGHELNLTMRKPPADHPQFEAAGVRGLIDPGGYSASTQAAAASGLIKGIADINRSENAAAQDGNQKTACSLEPRLKRAVAESPESGDANLNLGEFYLAHGQTARALPLLERAHTLNAEDTSTRLQLAEAFLRAGRFTAASQLLSETAAATEDPAIHRLRARADEGLGRFAEATQEYRFASQRDPSEENLFGAGYELILQGLPKDAERAFAAGLPVHPQSQKLWIGLGSAQFLAGQAAESVRSLLNAVEIKSNDPRPYPFLSQASSVSTEQAPRVGSAFEGYALAAPDDPYASYYLALNLLRSGPANEANDLRIETLLQHAIHLDAGLADAHYHLGVLYGRRGNYQRALQELEDAVRLSPNSAEAHYHLALAYRQTHRKDESAREIQRFQETRASSTPTTGEARANIDQFISVFAEPASAKKSGNICPGDVP